MRTSVRNACLFAAAAMQLLAAATPALAQTGNNVLVVVNSASEASQTIGRQYAQRRSVPNDNVCAIQLAVGETVSRRVYDTEIEQPIWKCIVTRKAHDRILYIVLTKDVPIRVAGTIGRNGTNASVDSELALLYRRRTGAPVPIMGFVANPYFAGASGAAVPPFSHRTHDIYLVTRLDGFSVQDALSLIEHGSVAGVADGRFVLDERGVDLEGDHWLAAAAERLKAQGLADRVVLDTTPQPVTSQSRVVGYYSWGSNDAAGRNRTPGFDFAPGALAGMFVSTDARTFKEPPATWKPTGQGRGELPFAGTSESLVADSIRAGVSGASGNVDEPYLDAAIRPDILFPAYATGRNLAEAFYAAMPYLSWQTIVLGDPLCAPFPRTPLPAEEADPPADAISDLPAYFTRQQLAAMHPALPRDAAAAFIRFEYRMLVGDVAGARRALETAIAAEPRFIPARVELATMDDRAGDRERAIEQYRAILVHSPKDPFALNNLAYAIAVYEHDPEQALPLAERATANSRNDPELLGGTGILANYYTLGSYHREPLVPYCLDTLAWVEHLLGRDSEAMFTIQQARSTPGPQTAEIMWHAAVIAAAVNDLNRARAELNAALKTDPELADRDDVKKLRQQLGWNGS